MRRLVYRVDGGATLGLGHVARAYAITDVARRRSWQVTWATGGGPEVESAAKEAGAPVVKSKPGESESAFLARMSKGADAVVIDRKLPYAADVIRGLAAERPVMLLDVPCEGMFAATVTVFPTAHLDPVIEHDPRWPKPAILKHGASWVVVHPRVVQTPRLPKPAEPWRVAVTTGGSDPVDVASAALDWLDAVDANFQVDLMVGVANPRRDALRRRAESATHLTRVLERPEEFAAELAGATLAVATFGITAYELAYLGVPAVLVSHNEENAAAAVRFTGLGTAVDLGLYLDIKARKAADEITRLFHDPGRRREMTSAGRKLVDGNGAERIVELVESLVGERKK